MQRIPSTLAELSTGLRRALRRPRAPRRDATAAAPSAPNGPQVRRPGNVVLRRRRLRTETVSLDRERPWPQRLHALRPRRSPWYLVSAFGLVILLGALLLSLPVSSESRSWTNGLDALFTATSAVCVTGLSRFDSAEHWSGFGEVVLLGLIQLGGLGVTIYAGSLLLLLRRRFGLRGSELFGMELSGSGEWDIGRVLRRVVIFVVATETTTFLLLLPWFVAEFDLGGGAWRAVFHTVSAFNNAGFDLMGGGTGFIGQISDPYPIVVMGIAAFLGSVSFVTVFDLPRGRRRWSLDTRFVLVTMIGCLVIGMIVVAAGEVQSGHVLGDSGAGDITANSFFLSVNRTTGMSTVDFSQLQDVTTVLLLPLMVIGGASTSTAGGIKVGAFMVGIAVVWSMLRGRHSTEIFGREIPHAVVLRATGVNLLAVAAITVGVAAIEITESGGFLPLTFEVISALANVGWSQGVTPGLSDAGVLIVIALMFMGRLGPLMVALTVPDRSAVHYRFSPEGVRVG